MVCRYCVAEIAVRLATVAGGPQETGLAHDVIGVPDAILLKPGPLAAEGYEIVKRHATLGAEIVAEVLPSQQVMWVRHHHELRRRRLPGRPRRR